MYIDSGADVTLIPRQVGEALGLSFSKDKVRNIRGIGKGAIPVIISTVEVMIGTRTMRTRIAWSMVEDVPLILGRLDIFDAFKVTFNQKNSIVTFTS